MSGYEKALALWQSYNIKSVADLDKYLHSYRVLFAYNSGKIENEAITYHDTREIFENGKVAGFSGDPRVLFEQQNQLLCYELLKDKIVNKEPLSIALIKETHLALTGGTYDERHFIVNNERPGEFKKHDYVTGIHEVGSPAADVERDLSDLLDEVNDFSGEYVLKAAAYLHLKFEYIHPFADGNGRVGRTLLNYFLMTHGHPPMVIYDEDKSSYYACLQKYDEDEEIAPLEAFFKHETEKTWAHQVEMSECVSGERKTFRQDFRQNRT
jgi:Fic family protein